MSERIICTEMHFDFDPSIGSAFNALLHSPGSDRKIRVRKCST